MLLKILFFYKYKNTTGNIPICRYTSTDCKTNWDHWSCFVSGSFILGKATATKITAAEIIIR